MTCLNFNLTVSRDDILYDIRMREVLKNDVNVTSLMRESFFASLTINLMRGFKVKLSTSVLQYNAYELQLATSRARTRTYLYKPLFMTSTKWHKNFLFGVRARLPDGHLSHVRRLNKHDRRRHHREEIRAGSWLKLAAHLESKGLKWKKTRSPSDACRRNERDRMKVVERDGKGDGSPNQIGGAICR